MVTAANQRNGVDVASRRSTRIAPLRRRQRGCAQARQRCRPTPLVPPATTAALPSKVPMCRLHGSRPCPLTGLGTGSIERPRRAWLPGWCAFACTNIVQEIQNTLTTTHYALAVIGPDWLTMTSGAGQRWLDRLSFQSS